MAGGGMALWLVAGAWAADGSGAAPPALEVRPFGYVRPSGYWIEDSDASQADQDGFSLQARLGLRARYDLGPGCAVEAVIEADLTPDMALRDGFVVGRPVCWFGVIAGQYKIPWSLHQLSSDSRRQLPVSPRIVTATGIGRDAGLGAELKIPVAQEIRATASWGMFNGEGLNRAQNVNQSFAYAARGLITPFGAREAVYEGGDGGGEDGDGGLYLGIGGGWVYDLTGDGESAIERNSFGGDLQFAWRWLSLQGELMDTEVFHASPDVTDFHIRGGYAQAGLFLPFGWAAEHVEIAGRFERSDPDTAFADPGLTGSGPGAIPTFQAAQLWTAGLNLYLRRAPQPGALHDLKLQFAWTHPDEREGDPVEDDSFVGGATARF